MVRFLRRVGSVIGRGWVRGCGSVMGHGWVGGFGSVGLGFVGLGFVGLGFVGLGFVSMLGVRRRWGLPWEKLWAANTVKPTIACLQERRQKPSQARLDHENTNQQKPGGLGHSPSRLLRRSPPIE